MNNFYEFKDYISFLDLYLSTGITKSFRVFLLINKAVALDGIGDFNQALSIMKNIKVYMDKKANKVLKALYYNNYIAFLINMDKKDEAKNLYEQKLRLLSNTKSSIIANVIKSTIAEYNIFFGNPQESKKELLNLLPSFNDKLNITITEYYIAIADLKIGNKKEAKNRLERILNDTKGMFLYGKILKELKTQID